MNVLVPVATQPESDTPLVGVPYGRQYDPAMAKRELVGVQVARDTFASRVDFPEGKEPVHTVVAKRSVAKAVIVPIEWYREAAAALGDPTEF